MPPWFEHDGEHAAEADGAQAGLHRELPPHRLERPAFLASLDDRWMASLARHLLWDNGISSFLGDNATNATLTRLFSGSSALGQSLYVEEGCLEEARGLLDAYLFSAESPTDDPAE